MKLILTASLVLLMNFTNAAIEGATTTQKFVNFWKLVWCDFGGLYGFKDFACPPSIPVKPMISAGQRTNNTAGYALDAKLWVGSSSDFTSDVVYV